MNSTKSRDVNQTRTIIAFTVIGLGIVGITVISWVAINNAASDDKAEMSRLVFTAVLPLLGTWVGAVLAFYFSRDNLQAASETTLDAVRAAGGLGADTPVASIMTRLDRIRPREDVANKSAARSLSLKNLYDKMQASGQSRVPVLTTAGTPIYVVHEPDVDKFAQAKNAKSVDLGPSDTLESLLADDAMRLAVETFAAVPLSATLAEARTALGRVPGAKDLFVTDDGKTTGKVIGWLTNSDLARST